MRRSNSPTSTRWCACGVVVALLTAGCARTGSPAPAPQLPPAGQVSSVSLPLDSYLASPAEQERTDRAQALLERVCLRRFGLSWSGPGEDDLLTGEAIRAAEQAARFGLVDRAQAARYGYHQPPWSVSALAANQGHSATDDPPPEVAKVLFHQAATVQGQPVPSGGCRGDAARQLATGANDPVDPTLVTRIRQDADRRVAEDPRTGHLLDRWRACMAEAGYHYPTPAQAARDVRWRQKTQPTAAEIAVATTDVDCKDRVSYLTSMANVTAEHQRALMSAHADELARTRNSLETRIANADRVLASPSAAPSATTSTQGR